jgi:catechol 2,3-dioxygenase-like lactoylglutathione lyase family enzyme
MIDATDISYYASPMAMGKRQRDRQPAMWVAATDLPRAAKHPFCRRLNQLLAGQGDDCVEAQCAGFHAETMGRPGLPPGIYPQRPGNICSPRQEFGYGNAMRSQPLVCVTDVEASSGWYQRLLGCRGAHGGRQYEQLVKDGRLILQLHSFDVEHHHGPIGNRADRPYGNGVLLWFEVDDFDAVMQRAAETGAEIVLPRHRNPADREGGPNHWECWMRDPDGYTVVVASPYGTADGAWRPGPDLFT